MLEHFSRGNVMALCTNLENLNTILSDFTHEDCENVRRLLSFRKLVENSPMEERIKLLTDTDYFLKVLKKELKKTNEYIDNFHLFLRCLHVLVQDLPKSSLGKQVNAGTVSKNNPLTKYFVR